MNLPKQIEDQLKEVERIEAEIEAANQPPVEETPEKPAEEVAAETPKEETAAKPETPPAQEPEVLTPKQPEVSEETWERRFKTLQGKYNAEVPRMSTELKELRAEVTRLTEAAKAKPREPEKPLITDKDVETFGGDLLDVIDRKAREVASTMVGTEMAELRAENQKLQERLDGVDERQVTNTRQAYFAELTRQVPDWEAINVDQGFLDWLGETDPLSGAQRQAYLDSAFASGDVHRTAALFSTYKQMTAPPAPPAPAAANKELERQVAPGTSKVASSQPTSNSSDKIWSMKEIDQFFTDASKGKYRDNPAEAARIEQEIDLAVAAGRVRA